MTLPLLSENLIWYERYRLHSGSAQVESGTQNASIALLVKHGMRRSFFYTGNGCALEYLWKFCFKKTTEKKKKKDNKKTKHVSDKGGEKKWLEVLYITVWGGSIAEALYFLAEGRGAVCNHPGPTGCALPVSETPSCLKSQSIQQDSVAPLFECAGICTSDCPHENGRRGRCRGQQSMLVGWWCTVRKGGCFPVGPSAADSPVLSNDTL